MVLVKTMRTFCSECPKGEYTKISDPYCSNANKYPGTFIFKGLTRISKSHRKKYTRVDISDNIANEYTWSDTRAKVRIKKSATMIYKKNESLQLKQRL